MASDGGDAFQERPADQTRQGRPRRLAFFIGVALVLQLLVGAIVVRVFDGVAMSVVGVEQLDPDLWWGSEFLYATVVWAVGIGWMWWAADAVPSIRLAVLLAVGTLGAAGVGVIITDAPLEGPAGLQPVLPLVGYYGAFLAVWVRRRRRAPQPTDIEAYARSRRAHFQRWGLGYGVREWSWLDYQLKQAGHSESARKQAWTTEGDAKWWDERQVLVAYMRSHPELRSMVEISARFRNSHHDPEMIWAAWYEVMGLSPPGPGIVVPYGY